MPLYENRTNRRVYLFKSSPDSLGTIDNDILPSLAELLVIVRVRKVLRLYQLCNPPLKSTVVVRDSVDCNNARSFCHDTQPASNSNKAVVYAKSFAP